MTYKNKRRQENIRLSYDQFTRKIKEREGKNYKGLISIASALTEYYLSEYYEPDEEYSFFEMLFIYRFGIRLLFWLAIKHRKFMDVYPDIFEQLLLSAKEDITQEKRIIYNLWKNNKLQDHYDFCVKLFQTKLYKIDKYYLMLKIDTLKELLNFNQTQDQLIRENLNI